MGRSLTLPLCLLVLAGKNGVAFTPWVALTGEYTPDVHHPLLPGTPPYRVEATNKSKGVTNMESRFPGMLVLWLGREFYRGKYGIIGSSQTCTPDFGDKSMIPENATLFSISLLGKKIRLNARENSVTSRPIGESM
ncbi:hypothetical protein AVEN_232114-1 [Araneus ventricosus]|uniref:Uncharacterized protein n=1 Tax=Araneus ventricosus TaxID=182803 RepID=A0A4Y2FS15_ARAVE|nr:hypothetical protein AVEN_232114-1 [Araneus ventricosus]